MENKTDKNFKAIKLSRRKRDLKVLSRRVDPTHDHEFTQGTDA